MTRRTLDISSDGEIIAAIRIRPTSRHQKEEHKIYNIPFETIINDIYHRGTREKLCTIFHLIKNCNTLLPNEVLSPVMKFLLALHQYSTNQDKQPA